MKFLFRSLLLLFMGLSVLHAETRTVKIGGPVEVFELFDKVGYTKQRWEEGIREVPRIYLSEIPERWRENSRKLTVAKKKAIFFRLLAPAVLRANELIRHDRAALKKLLDKGALNTEERAWLTKLAAGYGLKADSAEAMDAAWMHKLLERVDAIPVSLALAQSAEESGWGTSRFALLGNSLFGQWDFSGKGITPKDQRKELGNYGLARFNTPQDAVNAYIRNLNTHRAYAELRRMRSQMRAEGRPLSGYELATTLTKYSERGEAYVKTLHAIMRVNRLQPVDDAYLWNKEVIVLVPAGKK